MLQKIKALFGVSRQPDVSIVPDYKEQAALARQICDKITVSRKLDLTLQCTVNLGEMGFMIHDLPGNEAFFEFLYNFVAAFALEVEVAHEADKKANLTDFQKRIEEEVKRRDGLKGL